MPAHAVAPSALLLTAALLATAARAPASAHEARDGAAGASRGRIFHGGSPDPRGERLRPVPHGPGRHDGHAAYDQSQPWTHGGRRLERGDVRSAWTHGGRVLRDDEAPGHISESAPRRDRAQPRWHDAVRDDSPRHRDARRFGIRSGAAAGGADRRAGDGAHVGDWRDAPRQRAGSAYPDGSAVPFTHPSLRRGPSLPAPLRRYPEER